MADEVIWDKEIDVPQKWIKFVDKNVLAGTYSHFILILSPFIHILFLFYPHSMHTSF